MATNSKQPAAERQIGFRVAWLLSLGLLACLLYLALITSWMVFSQDSGHSFRGDRSRAAAAYWVLDSTYSMGKGFYEQGRLSKDAGHFLALTHNFHANFLESRDAIRFFLLGFVFLLGGWSLYINRSRYAIVHADWLGLVKLPLILAGLYYAYTYAAPYLAPAQIVRRESGEYPPFALDSPLPSLVDALLAFGVPVLFPALFILPTLLKDYFKEHPLYRRLFVLSRGEEAARWAGIRQFIAMDWTAERVLARSWLGQGGESAIYLGKTLVENDFRLFGRHVALKSEQHMMTIATTGGGKSRDAIWNTLLTYRGGVICFDPKGEHVRVTYQRRKNRGRVYLLDPFAEVRDVQASNFWNPLDEIHSGDPSAREKLKRLASACVYAEKGEGGNAAHFRENAQLILRGFIGYAKAELPLEQRTLPVVYDLLATGEPNGKFANPAKWENLLAEMATCDAFGGAPRDAAGLLLKVSERERGSYISTIVRGMDWVNGAAVRAILSQASDFSLSEAKSQEASIFLVSPEQHIEEMSRFMRMFYTVAFDVCDSHVTPQPAGSERRVLFIFDEFNKLGTFKPAEDAILVKRSSHIKCWFIVQNMGQLFANYENPDNFLSCCDQQYFGMARTDSKAPELLEKALGQYVEGRYEGDQDAPHYIETKRPLFSRSDLAEFVNNESDLQIVIPIKGRPMKLRRVAYFKNFAKATYGQRAKAAA